MVVRGRGGIFEAGGKEKEEGKENCVEIRI